MGNTLNACGCANNEASVVEAEQQTEAQIILQQQWSACTLHNPDLDKVENEQDYQEKRYNESATKKGEPFAGKSEIFLQQSPFFHMEKIEVESQDSEKQEQQHQFVWPLRDFVQTPAIVTFQDASESSLNQSMASNNQSASFENHGGLRIDHKEIKSTIKKKEKVKDVQQQDKKKQSIFINKSPSERKQKSARKRAYLEEKEIIIKEGELLKICPGIARQTNKNKKDSIGGNQFVTRWCQLTQNRFRYYKNKINAYKNPEKPLLSIPLAEIINIAKQKLNKDEVQFEIVLGKEMSKYHRLRGAAEKIFETPSKRIDQESPDRAIRAGHLIRVPLQMKETQGSPLKNNEHHTQSRNKGFKRQYQTSICTNEENNDKNHWSKREEEWYNLEEMLVFKNNATNMTEGDITNISTWIKLINNQRLNKTRTDLNNQTIKTNNLSQSIIYQSPNWVKETTDKYYQ